jgi:hypothetical protein
MLDKPPWPVYIGLAQCYLYTALRSFAKTCIRYLLINAESDKKTVGFCYIETD